MKTLFTLLAITFPTLTFAADFKVMAHRGLYQNYPRENLERDTCTAKIIFQPTHPYLENTIPAIYKAFELHADLVEIDIHSTTDGKIVVFHDWDLDCRTNGKGITQEQSFEYLRGLDIGYGYTADEGKTFPFRCTTGDLFCLKRNQMPTLREVLQAFPKKKFMINMKGKESFTLNTLVQELKSIRQELNYDLKNLFFYCDDQFTNDRMRRLLPEITTPKLARVGVEACWQEYFRNKAFPVNCYNAHLAFPADQLMKLGKDATARMVKDANEIGSEFWVIRVDDEAAFKFVSQFPIHGIWTDEIDVIGPLVGD